MTKFIYFSGVHGSGKTTLMYSLTKRLLNKKFSVNTGYHGIRESVSRDARDLGFNINQETDVESQYYMGCKYMSVDVVSRFKANQSDYDYVLFDRSPLDVIPYVRHFVKNKDSMMSKEKYLCKFLEDMLVKHVNYFKPDYMFYVCSFDKNKVEVDDVRSGDVKFRNDIEKEFDELFLNDPTWLNNGYIISHGTVEERTDNCLSLVMKNE